MIVKRPKLNWDEMHMAQVRDITLSGRLQKMVLMQQWRNPITGELGQRHMFYKFSSTREDGTPTGFEAINEFLAAKLLAVLGIPHIDYTLSFVDKTYDGTIMRLPCCTSYDYKSEGQTAIPLELYCAVMQLEPDAAMNELGLQNSLNQMYLADYLLRNIRRTCRDIELYTAADGRIAMAPLFDNGDSLIVDEDMLKLVQRGQLKLTDDVQVEGINGAVWLTNNLEHITQPVLVHKLTNKLLHDALYGFRSVLTNGHVAAIEEMVRVRYDNAKQAGILVEG